ncbi:MAG: hypothetical protein U5J64_04470 [Halobacteriales archaeon]|nr:hypothetical protein [Halobacteriales archaeon]
MVDGTRSGRMLGAVLLAVSLTAATGCLTSDTYERPPLETPETVQTEIEVEGFGAGTVGGWQEGHDVVNVTSLKDDGPGGLREALRTDGEPRVVRFDVDGDIHLRTPLSLPSNITLDGRGADVNLVGKGLLIHGVENVVVTHIDIVDVGPDTMDGVQIGTGTPGGDARPSRNVVVDHVRFTQNDGLGDSDYVDEAISVIYGSTDITVQWSRFENIEKVVLIGNGDAPPELDSRIRVTMHNNYFVNTGRRHPRVRYGRVDFYNNYVRDWYLFEENSMDDLYGDGNWRRSYGSWCHTGCEMIVEENVFERQTHQNDDSFGTSVDMHPNHATLCYKPPFSFGEGEGKGAIDDRGSYVPQSSEAELRFNVGCDPDGNVFDRPYDATVETANDDLRRLLSKETGDGQR